MSGNKMDTTNLATLFAPSLMHTFKEEGVKPGVIHGNVAAAQKTEAVTKALAFAFYGTHIPCMRMCAGDLHTHTPC